MRRVGLLVTLLAGCTGVAPMAQAQHTITLPKLPSTGFGTPASADRGPPPVSPISGYDWIGAPWVSPSGQLHR